MSLIKKLELDSTEVRKVCDVDFINNFKAASQKSLDGIIGQERAVKAIHFGLGIQSQGFNIFVAGKSGTGRTTAMRAFLKEYAKTMPVPPDWCYVYNFDDPYKPIALELEAGKAEEFRKDIEQFINDEKRIIPAVFESPDYISRRVVIVKNIEEKRDKVIKTLSESAKKEGFLVNTTQAGVVLIPLKDGKPMKQEEFLALPSEKQKELEEKRKKIATAFQKVLEQTRIVQREIVEAVKELDKKVGKVTIEANVNVLHEKYKKNEKIVNYISSLSEDILNNIDDFKKPKTTSKPDQTGRNSSITKKYNLRKYHVNVIVDNSKLTGAPVIYEQNPTHHNLLGTIEREALLGALITDFTLIRGGALHSANGGFLVLPAEEVVSNAISYEGLKRAIRNECIKIEEIGRDLTLIATKGLAPQPVPFNAKVILVGEPSLYQLLQRYDRDFSELFKIQAAFDTVMKLNQKSLKQYSAFICTICRKENLLHFDGSGVAKLIEYSSRIAGHKNKLSTQFGDVADIIREANHYANESKSEFIRAEHIMKSVEERVYRSNLIQEKINEYIKNGVSLIDVEGKKVGQINGLAVLGLGNFAFGKPSRITASIGLGKSGIINVERESEMSGPTHTKGILILGGYLTEKFAQDKPLALSAKIVFEQSYSGVDGDSASSTELYAILSSLSEKPIKQYIAVTGSVNQKGEVQAIGGVNEKIEGYYEVCKVKGITGKQGVMIPKSNVQNLMLKEEIVEAVKAGKFHIYSVSSIDEGIEILTDTPSKEIHKLANGKLEKMALEMKKFPEDFGKKTK
ncbi:MAG: AAA family ATPase [Candidatus Ranarchaeia archaeon]